jgi:hypothetical protein
MKHHGGELDHQNEGEKEYEHKAYRLQLEVLLGYQDLEVKFMWLSLIVHTR